MRIAIDAMGGDHAPKIVVEGALAAAKEWKDVRDYSSRRSGCDRSSISQRGQLT